MMVEALPALSPRRDWMRQHLDALFSRVAEAVPGLLFELRAIHPNGKVFADHFDMTEEGFNAALDWAGKLNGESGFNVYVGINPRRKNTLRGRAATAADVYPLHFWHAADADTPEAVEALRKNERLPHRMMVATGMQPTMRVHCYWQLDEPTRNSEAWTQVQRHLQRAFGGDAIHDPPRIMRLAGTISFPSEKKAAKGYRAEIVQIAVYEDRDPVAPEALLAISLPEAPAETGPLTANAPAVRGQIGPLNLRGPGINPQACIDAINRGEELHNNTRDLVAYLVGIGQSDWLVTSYCEALLRPVSDGGTLAEIPKLIRSARKKFNKPEPVLTPLEAPALPKSGVRLTPVHWSKAAEVGDANWLVKGLLGENGLSVIYGPPGSAKTFLGLDISAHIALGWPWRDRRVEQGGIVYVAAEGGFGLSKRQRALWKHYGIDPTEVPFWIIGESLDLRSSEADCDTLVGQLQQLPTEVPLRMIVVDTLSRALAGGNENSPDEMGAFVKRCDRLRQETGAHVSIIHHTGKDESRGARGHSLLRAAADTEISVVYVNDTVTAEITKQREGEVGGCFGFKLHSIELGYDSDGEAITSCVLLPTEGHQHPKSNRAGKLPDASQIALAALREALHGAGQTVPTSNHIPQGVEVVSTGLWRDYAYAASISKGETEDAKRKAFKRASDRLIAEGMVGVWKDYAWLVQE